MEPIKPGPAWQKFHGWQKKRKEKFHAAATKASNDQPRAHDDLNDTNVVVTLPLCGKHCQSKVKLFLLGIKCFFYFFLHTWSMKFSILLIVLSFWELSLRAHNYSNENSTCVHFIASQYDTFGIAPWWFVSFKIDVSTIILNVVLNATFCLATWRVAKMWTSNW